MFAYCGNNPVNMVDLYGRLPKWIKDATDWIDDKIIQPLSDFAEDLSEDFENYDTENESEDVVLQSHYFSSYKGIPVFRIDGDRSGSFGIIFITRETNNRRYAEDVVRHEYGHTIQLKQLGIPKYLLCIALPSWQEWGSGPYYCKPFELTADLFGGVQSRPHSQEEIDAAMYYLYVSEQMGTGAWCLIPQ